MMRFTVKGLDRYREFLKSVPEAVADASHLAVSSATRFAYAAGSRAMRKEINFSQTYLGEKDRYAISQRAKKSNPEAIISARQRATSLARFANDRRTGPTRKGLTVEVARGRKRKLRQAFLIKLKAGPSFSEDNYNIGLAVRLKPGERVKNKREMAPYMKKARKASDANLYLLYGPSVDQVFRGVIPKIEPAISNYLESEFLRQMERNLRG